MTFYVFGLNHKTAPVAVRQAFALSEDARRAFYRTIALSDEAEFILLSTCNRTEVYLYGQAADVRTLRSAMSVRAGTPWPEEYAFSAEDETAVRHLLQVACGIRSQVIGDAQILSQVKEAYRVAVEEDCVGTVLHRLMHTAFRTAKRTISETGLGAGTASVATAAVALAQAHLGKWYPGGLQGRRVLLVGAGQMGWLALEALRSHGLARLSITNRTPGHTAPACTLGADMIPWEDRHAAVQEHDLVIVATGAPEPVLMAEAMPRRCAHAPQTLLIDIAVPRNIDPAIDALPGYTVADLDVLSERLSEVRAQRQAEVPAAEQICEEALAEFVAWVFHQQGLQPAIQAIRETFEAIRLQEVERHHHRFSELDRAELDRLTVSIMQKLLAVPIVRLKNVDPNSIDFVRGIKLLHALFARADCEDPSASPTRAPELSADLDPLDAPARCPFEAPALETLPVLGQQLRDALRLPPKT